MNCRHCNSQLTLPFIDLASAPPSNSYLTEKTLHEVEHWYPLRLLVCEKCWLVQTEDFVQADTFFNADYAYFSSFSDTWVAHCQQYANNMIQRFSLNKKSHIVEIASNDGCLLQFFHLADIPCLGIEPTSGTASEAKKKGLKIIIDFFTNALAQNLAKEHQTADLITANNVLAHVPEINDFLSGIVMLLKPLGVATFEFPHLLRLIEENQFDTIYHEHFSYLSLTSIQSILNANGLSIFDVEELSTHGGSLRLYVQKSTNPSHDCTDRIQKILDEENNKGISTNKLYSTFQHKAEQVKNDLLRFLIECKEKEITVAAYGAAAKGNTLLNYAGVKPDLIQFIVDRNPAKQGKFMPGSRIPIVAEEYLKQSKPDRVLILPWNLQTEIINQLNYIRNWGGKFVTAIPEIKIGN